LGFNSSKAGVLEAEKTADLENKAKFGVEYGQIKLEKV